MTAKNLIAESRESTVRMTTGETGRKISTISTPVMAASHNAKVMK